jgi:preprotein translocase subunit Sec61beta
VELIQFSEEPAINQPNIGLVVVVVVVLLVAVVLLRW